MSSIDIESVRRDTPGCLERAHFNNAGAALMPNQVLEAVIGHLELETQIGGYEAAAAAHDRLEAVYTSAASLLNCDPSEVALTENATRAFNAVLYALPFESGDRILTGKAEYCSNYMAYLHLARTTRIEVVVVPDDEYGQIDVDELKRRINGSVKLIALTHVPTSGGLVNPAAAVGRVAREAGVAFLLDACQSVGQMPIDVQEIGCDFLSTTGRKYLRGPRGTGLLYVKRERINGLHPPMVDVGGADWTRLDSYEFRPDARRFETWEAAHALRLGLGRAIDYAVDIGLEEIWVRVQNLADSLRNQLAGIPAVRQHDLGAVRCGIVSFSVTGVSPDVVKATLARRNVNIELSSVDDTRLDLEERGLSRFLRASVHYYNTHEEVTRLSQLIGAIANEDRVALAGEFVIRAPVPD
ncbi:MAG: aminotransferase class V-fold PLP-dependent enzyme [Fimbriimonadales bacterium]